jgi:hypothetical protein
VLGANELAAVAMIAVVVVESHHHALEHIHDVLRRRRLLNSKWSMLHFDSHADLACPGDHIPAVSCFQPRKTIQCMSSRIAAKSGEDASEGSSLSSDGNSTHGNNLYELLDSTSSGIAEWILPLVLAANLRTLQWIRPPGTIHQIPTGQREYHVGAWFHRSTDSDKIVHIESFHDLPLTATVKVDWDCRYYLEDNSYVPPNQLVLSQPLHLTVSEGPTVPVQSLDPDVQIDYAMDDNMFALDICLDYFVCLNPFVTDIEEKDAEFAKALVAAVTEARFYKEDNRTDTYQTELSRFRGLWQDLLESYAKIDDTSTHQSTLTALLSEYYDTHTSATRRVEAVQDLLFVHENKDERDALIRMSVEAIPNLTMPHSSVSRDADAVRNSIQSRLLHLRQVLRRCGTSEPPFIITVARSMNDGFTPQSVVEELQVSVLREIHDRFCGCSAPNAGPVTAQKPGQSSLDACSLHIIFDYSIWEGSTFA